MSGQTATRAALMLVLASVACGGDDAARLEPREDAYRANNRGIARLEQFDYPAAAAAFRDALALDDTLAIARVNLALALYYDQDLAGAAMAATQAATELPPAPEPRYLLGLIARAENRADDARGWFSQVQQQDPGDVGTNIMLGQIHLEARDYAEAIERLRLAFAEEPYNVTAAYSLGLALARSGETVEGQELLEQAQVLRATGYAVTFGAGYLEAGRYAEAIASTGAEPELVDRTPPAAVFTVTSIAPDTPRATATASPFGRRFGADELTGAGARALAASLSGGVTPIDVDSDGDLDLFLTSADGQQLVRNDGAETWTVITAEAGLASAPPDTVPIGAVAADFDNNDAPDLFVLRYGGNSLYRNDGDGRFTDVTATASFPPYLYLPSAAAFTDIDHDGDVDLVIAGWADLEATRDATGDDGAVFPGEFAAAPLSLLRNNQDGTFTEITSDARLESRGHVVALVPTDFDNRRDVDLLVVNRDAPPRLFTNLRDGTFRDVAAEVGLSGIDGRDPVAAVAAADLNKDDYPDFFFARASGGVFALSDGRGGFTLTRAPEATRAATAAQLFDYDNDGLLDLLTWSANGPHLLRNLGQEWTAVTDTAGLGTIEAAVFGSAHALAASDLDVDGDTDIIAAGPEMLSFLDNAGEPRNRSMRVQLAGLASNRLGIGSKIQLRAGSLSGRLETSATAPAVAPADLVFGLGERPGADVVRLLWPSGTLQAEVAEPPEGSDPTTQAALPTLLASPLVVRELDRKPSSCPFLFTWNGTRFEFVTDFLGGGEMGYWRGPGVYNAPDPVEYVRIREDQLRPRDGVFELRVTNELEEALFLDRVELVALAHPRDIELFPNEGMTASPKPFRLHAVSDLRAPAGAVDDRGHDVTERIARLDRRYADGFTLTPFRGHADPHTLTLDLGDAPRPAVLLLTGWTDYAFSSDNVAAHQAGVTAVAPSLQIKGGNGRWRAANAPIGIPVGRPQTIAVDLSADLGAGEREVRIVTNMRIYWDQILVGRGTSTEHVRITRLAPRDATLRLRGFSAEVRPHGSEPPIYDYARVTPTSPWKTMAGRYTRAGDVLDLLTRSDDMFVITRDGDEVAVEFEATALEPLPEGWTRTFLLHADGFSKEMDINSASPDAVEPLPFHRMTGYPYGEGEHYPQTPEHRRYRETYNTRSIVRSVPLLETAR